ncbi:MAG: hypothetical protein ACKO3W_00660, partial [bacterium]
HGRTNAAQRLRDRITQPDHATDYEQDHRMSLVLFSNLLWIVVCTVWCLLCVGQARADRAKGGGFQRPLSKEELER